MCLAAEGGSKATKGCLPECMDLGVFKRHRVILDQFVVHFGEATMSAAGTVRQVVGGRGSSRSNVVSAGLLPEWSSLPSGQFGLGGEGPPLGVSIVEVPR